MSRPPGVGEVLLNDGIATLLSVLYIGAVVGSAEALRKSARLSFDLSRKWIHVGIGTWILPTTLLFHSPFWAAFLPGLFVVLNAISHRRKLVRAMDEESGDNLGTVLFPLAFVLLIAFFWDREGGRAALVGGILVLAWGDAAAALVGKRFGRRRYRVGSSWRSLEGSTAMLLLSAVAIAAAGRFVGAEPYAWGVILGGAVLATALEAGSLRGFDNLIVPLGTALFLWGLG